MSRLAHLPLAALLLLSLAQCRKAPPAPDPPADLLTLLPAETTTGAGTFGCLLNGKAMSVKDAFLITGQWPSSASFHLTSQTSVPQPEYAVQFLLNGSFATGQTFNLIPVNRKFGSSNEFVADANYGKYACTYSGSYVKTGSLAFTRFDGVARIAAGRFHFTLYEPGGCDTLRVTNGRFDVRF